MNAEDTQKIKEAIRHWAEEHAAPDSPCFLYAGRKYTPRDIADEAEQEIGLGQSFLVYIMDVVDRNVLTLDQAIQKLTGGAPKRLQTAKKSAPKM